MVQRARKSSRPDPRLDLLPEKIRDRLRNGDRTLSDHDVARSVVSSMLQHNFSDDEIVTALRGNPNGAGAIVRNQRRDGTRRKVLGLIKHQRHWIAQHPPLRTRPDALAEVAAVEAAADAMQWPGRTGSTDRAVLAALLRLATRGGGAKFRASERQIAEHAGVTQKTARRSLRRLLGVGWLQRIEAGNGPKGSTWLVRVRPPETNVGTPVVIPYPGEGKTGVPTFVSLIQHAAFARSCVGADGVRASGLGHTGARVHALLLHCPDPLTTTQIADGLGISAQTVRIRLRQMESAMLVERLSDRSWRPSETDPETVLALLDGLASRLQTVGRGKRLRARHEDQRAEYRQRLARAQTQIEGPETLSDLVVEWNAAIPGAATDVHVASHLDRLLRGGWEPAEIFERVGSLRTARSVGYLRAALRRIIEEASPAVQVARTAQARDGTLAREEGSTR